MNIIVEVAQVKEAHDGDQRRVSLQILSNHVRVLADLAMPNEIDVARPQNSLELTPERMAAPASAGAMCRGR